MPGIRGGGLFWRTVSEKSVMMESVWQISWRCMCVMDVPLLFHLDLSCPDYSTMRGYNITLTSTSQIPLQTFGIQVRKKISDSDWIKWQGLLGSCNCRVQRLILSFRVQLRLLGSLSFLIFHVLLFHVNKMTRKISGISGANCILGS